MKISATKTEAMKISKTPGPLNITADNNRMKQVEEFKYLGSVIYPRWQNRQRDRGKNKEGKYCNIPAGTNTCTRQCLNGDKTPTHQHHLYTNPMLPSPNLDDEQKPPKQNKCL